MSTVRHLPATADAPALARGAVRFEFVDCEEEFVTAAELMVSELVSNAVLHGSSPIELELLTVGDIVRATVTDGGTGRPVPKSPESDDPHGRGLLIVRLLAHEWGVVDAGAGKSVWFTLQRREAGQRPAMR